ncbi:MAG: tRNA 5-methoxyuridine(34)/uridine 5-oxyacetic acid(34) synthase CmoB [Chloroflexota bacterium]
MNQAHLSTLYAHLEQTKLAPWLSTLPQLVEKNLAPSAHGKMSAWQATLAQLPSLSPDYIELNDRFELSQSRPLEPAQLETLQASLMALHPWRKGPFHLFGLHIETEWRSDWKWSRVLPHLSPLEGKRVLDIGSGNGYYGWRMLAHNPRMVLGLDPFLVYSMQYWAMQRFLPDYPNWVLPLGVEALLAESRAFDTVFSMGVLYHRHSPFDHLITCRDSLRSKGELILETLVIDGPLGEVLVPEGRYAQMRNVWFLPSVLTLESWLRKAQFKEIRCVNVTPTTTQEQRTTEWMTFHSLKDFLDPNNLNITVEGHPAPMRAVFVAQAP